MEKIFELDVSKKALRELRARKLFVGQELVDESIAITILRLQLATRAEKDSVMVLEFFNTESAPDNFCFPKSKRAAFKLVTEEDLTHQARAVFDFCKEKGLKPALVHEHVKEVGEKIKIVAYW